MTDPLPVLLEGYYHDTLLQIAAANGLPTTDSAMRKMRKDALIQLLCERLYTPEQAKTSVAQLNAIQRTMLDRILLHGGEVETHILREELEHENLVQPAAGSQANSFDHIYSDLVLRGLVLSAGHPQSWNPSAKLDLAPGLRLVVPAPVRKGLPEPTLPSVEWGASTLPAPPVETSVSLAQRDLFIYWSHVRAQPITLTQPGLVQKRTLRALNEELLLPDPALVSATNEEQAPRLHFLRLLLQKLRLLATERVRPSGSGRHGAGTRLVADRQAGPVPEFWDKTVQERTNACLQLWMQMGDWSELSSLGMSTFDLDLHRARGMLLEQLRLLEPGIWLSADRFLSRLFLTISHVLLQSRYNGVDYRSWDVGLASPSYAGHTPAQEPGVPSRSSGGGRFAEIEGTFVGGALSGPLHWLGIVDISADGGRLLAFRINASGAAALGQADTRISAAESTQESEARLIVQPNFEVFALGPVSEGSLARLELFADRIKADRSAFQYTLSRPAIYRGQKAGVSVNQIILFLERVSGAALPQNVRRTLQEWGEQHERIVFHRGVALCEAASPAIMTELWNEPETRSHLQQLLTPTVALLKQGHAQTLRETLLQRGLLPALSTQADRCAGRLQARPDGELVPVHPGPDLLLETCLRNLAEPVQTSPTARGAVAAAQDGVPLREGRFYITEGAVRRAMARGLGVKEYLEQLKAVHHEPLPSPLQMRIKAWGRYYGKASLQQAVLLEVNDPSTADELMQDPELAPLLSRFAADPRGRLLMVHADDLERLHKLLEERGVEVSRQA